MCTHLDERDFIRTALSRLHSRMGVWGIRVLLVVSTWCAQCCCHLSTGKGRIKVQMWRINYAIDSPSWKILYSLSFLSQALIGSLLDCCFGMVVLALPVLYLAKLILIRRIHLCCIIQRLSVYCLLLFRVQRSSGRSFKAKAPQLIYVALPEFFERHLGILSERF